MSRHENGVNLSHTKCSSQCEGRITSVPESYPSLTCRVARVASMSCTLHCPSSVSIRVISSRPQSDAIENGIKPLMSSTSEFTSCSSSRRTRPTLPFDDARRNGFERSLSYTSTSAPRSSNNRPAVSGWMRERVFLCLPLVRFKFQDGIDDGLEIG